MTEPMTAREQMTPRERALKTAEAYFTLKDRDEGESLISLIHSAILADRAAERARLAQSGDVEAEALKMFAATSETQGSASFIEAAWRDLSERQRQIFRTLADYSIASRAATAEAARIEGRREGIEAAIK